VDWTFDRNDANDVLDHFGKRRFVRLALAIGGGTNTFKRANAFFSLG